MDGPTSDGEVVHGVYNPTAEEEIKKDTKERTDAVSRSLPIVKMTVEWFNDEITKSQLINDIDLHGKLSAETQIHAKQMLGELLAQKLGEYQAMIEDYEETHNMRPRNGKR